MNVLGLFAKHPKPGSVKTRLAASIGQERSADLYRRFLVDVLSKFSQTADRRTICFAPQIAESRSFFEDLGNRHYELWPQPDGDLGQRLAKFFQDQFDSGATAVVVMGTDSPTLPVQYVDAAIEHLQTRDCVVGPATDGGYYLLGLAGENRPLFDEIDWSGPAVLQQTIDRIEHLGLKLAVLDPWYDVDMADDLSLLEGHLRAYRQAGTDPNLPQTEDFFQGDK